MEVGGGGGGGIHPPLYVRGLIPIFLLLVANCHLKFHLLIVTSRSMYAVITTSLSFSI